MIEAHLPPDRARVVLHWFTGTRAQARRAVELGCYFSTRMLLKPAHRALVAHLPIERLLTETDGPFVEMEERPAVPADVMRTIQQLAAVREVETSEMSRVVLANLRALVSFND